MLLQVVTICFIQSYSHHNIIASYCIPRFQDWAILMLLSALPLACSSAWFCAAVEFGDIFWTFQDPGRAERWRPSWPLDGTGSTAGRIQRNASEIHIESIWILNMQRIQCWFILIDPFRLSTGSCLCCVVSTLPLETFGGDAALHHWQHDPHTIAPSCSKDAASWSCENLRQM